MAVHDSTLTNLLPTTTFQLAYALPLLFISLFLTFSGTFFTLDRTRSFAPNYHTVPGGFESPKHKLKWYLEGGIGGLAIGYSFGLHCSTFLALLIPAKTSSSALGRKSFIVLWVLSSTLTTILAGRWKWVALSLAGLTGGFVISLAVSVIIHPSLLTRIVLAAIFTLIITVLTLLPLARVQHATLRLAVSSIGAFGTVLAISILASIPAWANVWERFWLSDGDSWGISQERGLSASFCLFLLFGMLADFLLNKKFGECPDKQWDEYLAKYTINLPDREGTFRPFTSVWDRIFGRAAPSNSSSKEMTFPPDSELRIPASPSQKLQREPTFEFTPSPGFLKKSRSGNKRVPGSRGRKEGIKFKPVSEGLNSDEDEDDWDLIKGPPRPWLRTKSSSGSATTLVEELNIEEEVARIDKVKSGGNVPDYSDYEEDVTSINLHHREKEQDGSWSPGFLQKQRSSATNSTTATTAVEPTTPLSVPATPSLIKALDRLAIAQKDAYGQANLPRPGLPHLKSSDVGNDEGLPTSKPKLSLGQEPKWSEFWKDVDDKIHATR